eukprot:m.29505 g.29505  ORF g.29505 m.29505 type:complete len:1175 (+) comp8109_c0_seq2:281-3805(+)
MGRLPLHGAAAKGDALLVENTIKAGDADINSKDIVGSTALHWAAQKGHTAVAAVLVANEAKIDAKNKKGKTALDFAKDAQQEEVYDFLRYCNLFLAGKRGQLTKFGLKQSGNTQNKDGTPRRSPVRPHRTPQKDEVKRHRADMLKWAQSVADERLAEQREAERIAKLKADEEAQKQQAKEQHDLAAKAEINRLLSALRNAKAGEESPSKSPEKKIDIVLASTPTQAPKGKSQIATPASGKGKTQTDKKQIPAAKSHNTTPASARTSNKPSGIPSRTPVSTQKTRTAPDSPTRPKVVKAVRGRSSLSPDKVVTPKSSTTKSKSGSDRKLSIVQQRREKLLKEESEMAKERIRQTEERQAKARALRKAQAEKRAEARKSLISRSPTKLSGSKGRTSTSPDKSPDRPVAKKKATKKQPTNEGDAERKNSEMDSLMDEYIRVMQGMSGSTGDEAKNDNAEGTSPKEDKPGVDEGNEPAKEASEAEEFEGNNEEFRDQNDLKEMNNDNYNNEMERKHEQPSVPEQLFETIDGEQVPVRKFRVVRQEDKGLGVAVYSRKNSTWIFVKNCVLGGPFDMAGLLPGDLFVKINDTCVLNGSHAELVNLLKVAPESFDVIIAREDDTKRKNSTDKTPVASPDVMNDDDNNNTNNEARSPLTPLPPANNNTSTDKDGEKNDKLNYYKAISNNPDMEIKTGTIVRMQDRGLGIALYSNKESSVCVQMVEPDGPCAEAGIEVGDMFLELNGKNVFNLPHKDIVSIFQTAGDEIPFAVTQNVQVHRPSFTDTPDESLVNLKLETFQIHREGEAGLGVALLSSKTKPGVVIQAVVPSGPFGRAGVRAGHMFVEIDGLNVRNVSHSDVVEVLRSSGPVIQVVMVQSGDVPGNQSLERNNPPQPPPPADEIEKPTANITSSRVGGLELRRHEVERIPKKGLGLELHSKKKLIGVRIRLIEKDGPMELAGLSVGDVFVQVDGKPVLNATHKDVVNAFKEAPASFSVVVVSGDDFDKQTVNKEAEEPKPKQEQKKQQPARQQTPKSKDYSSPGKSKSPFGRNLDDYMGKNSRSSISVISDVRTGSGMRAWEMEDEEEDSRFEELENSIGFQAMKKAQQEARILKNKTLEFERQFDLNISDPTKAKQNGDGPVREFLNDSDTPKTPTRDTHRAASSATPASHKKVPAKRRYANL